MVVQPELYPSGLKLAGRRVVVVGGGKVAQRRIPVLLRAGARVEVISPATTPAVEGHARNGDIVWSPRGYAEGDLDGAWYAIVATDDREVNEAVSAEAETRRVFCVRSDDAEAATAWTPAVGRHGPLTVAVLGNGDPHRSAAVRDDILGRLRGGEIAAPRDRDGFRGVTLVGGGPGDPDLITVAGRRALQEADVVVSDRLAPRELLAELSPRVELIDAAKLPRGRAASQLSINEVLVDRARAGNAVVRLKGGDPYVFGRGFEEAIACADADVAFRVIPGITSSVGVPALAGIPVTHRGVAQAFTVVSGHLPPGHPDSLLDWDVLARQHGTLVLLMATEHLAEIAATLTAAGKDPRTPVGVVQDGSMATQLELVSTLDMVGSDTVTAAIRPPAVVVIGPVVGVASSVPLSPSRRSR